MRATLFVHASRRSRSAAAIYWGEILARMDKSLAITRVIGKPLFPARLYFSAGLLQMLSLLLTIRALDLAL